MSTIELYSKKDEAIDARDYYNHELGRRAVIGKLPSDDVIDYGGGPEDRIFAPQVDPACWVLIVED